MRSTEFRIKSTDPDVIRKRLCKEVNEKVDLLLGTPGESELLFTNGPGQTWIVDGQTLTETPLSVNNYVFCISDEGIEGYKARKKASNLGAMLASAGPCERTLFRSGKHVFWAQLSFENAYYLLGTHYKATARGSYPHLQTFVGFPNAHWADRVKAMFLSMVPKAARKPCPSNFCDSNTKEVFFYDNGCNGQSHGLYERDHYGTWSAQLLGYQVGEGEFDKKPEKRGSYDSIPEAKQAFEQHEHQTFLDGFPFERIVAIPLEPASLAPKPRAKPQRDSTPMALLKTKASVHEDLQEATRAWDNADREEAFALMRLAWERRPLRDLAELIETRSSSLQIEEVVLGRSAKAIKAWDHLWNEKPESGMRLLLDTLDSVPKKIKFERLERVLKRPPDPRVDSALLRYVGTGLFTATGSKRILKKTLDRLAEMRDVRQLEELRMLPQKLRSTRTDETAHFAADELESLYERLRARLQALGELTPTSGEAPLLKPPPALEKSLSGIEVASVLASPDNDDLRRSYAAHASTDDIRADLIRFQDQLKVSSADKKKSKDLINNHRRELLGPLAEVVKKTVAFRLGFLQSCQVKADTILSTEQAESLLWNTVEDIDFGHNRAIQELEMPLLHTMRDLALFPDNEEDPWRCQVSELKPRPTLRTLQVSGFTRKAHRVFSLHEIFPNLTRLEVELGDSKDAEEADLTTPMVHGLKELRIKTRDVVSWSTKILNSKSFLGKLEIEWGQDTNYGQWTFTPQPNGFALEMKMTNWPSCRYEVIEALWQATMDQITDCTIKGVASKDLNQALKSNTKTWPFEIDLTKLK